MAVANFLSYITEAAPVVSNGQRTMPAGTAAGAAVVLIAACTFTLAKHVERLQHVSRTCHTFTTNANFEFAQQRSSNA